jgi:phthalate 4,5-cis-dihydrodiol dehydrogenase
MAGVQQAESTREAKSDLVLRVGMAGLGAGARQVLPSFKRVPGVQLGAVADIREAARDEFRARGVPAFDSVEAMCRSDEVDAVWVATPNVLHMEHTIMAAECGKHVICEKPMALSLEQAQAMMEACERNGVKYVQGHSKIYNPPVRKIREVVASGQLGRLIQLNTWNYRNWLNQPRLATEVDTETGGGVAYRQGPHQTDVIRCIGGGMVKTVRGIAGRWNPNFNTEGNYSAFLEFEDGTPAMMSMNGYAHFNIVELTWGIGEGGQATPEDELYVKEERLTKPFEPEEKYKLPEYQEGRFEDRDRQRADRHQPFYGLTVASCERGDIRQSPDGLYLYTDEGRAEVPCDPDSGHASELAELYYAIAEDRPSFPDARWGMATLEVILAILESSREGHEIRLSHQVPYPQ